jgi:hypothetical protein
MLVSDYTGLQKIKEELETLGFQQVQVGGYTPDDGLLAQFRAPAKGSQPPVDILVASASEASQRLAHFAAMRNVYGSCKSLRGALRGNSKAWHELHRLLLAVKEKQ